MFLAIVADRRLISIVAGDFALNDDEAAIELPVELGLASDVLTPENWADTTAWLVAEDHIDEPEVIAPVPPAITQRQLRLTLASHSLLAQVEPAIAGLSEPQKTDASIEWQFASVFRRDHPLIAQIGAALDLDEPAIDAMWAEAVTR